MRTRKRAKNGNALNIYSQAQPLQSTSPNPAVLRDLCELESKTMMAWIFDVDGTLANTDHRKHFLEQRPKDWAGWHSFAYLDKPHRDIVQFTDVAVDLGYEVLICSGRSEDHREMTERWLETYDIGYAALYMRAAADFRDDSIIKLELLERMRADGFDPILAFDDRDRVVAAWRSAGIRCLQVAPGSF